MNQNDNGEKAKSRFQRGHFLKINILDNNLKPKNMRAGHKQNSYFKRANTYKPIVRSLSFQCEIETSF